MKCWIFPLDSRDLYRFYSAHMDDASLYYGLYVEKCMQDLSAGTREALHLRDDSVLLVDPYLIPVYYRLYLKGYVIIIAEAFFTLNEHKALLKLSFSHVRPEGIIDMGYLNGEQKKCMDLLYMEYCSQHDDMRAPALRNLLVNMVLLSSAVNYEGQLKSGHLLNHALQFMGLIDNYAVREKKINFYAGRIGITEKMLRKSLQLIYNKTFREILTNRILIEAMKLLVFGNKSITRIAHELDYDVSDFIRFFSHGKGMHPKDLRISYREIINEIENGY
ncbi:MAG: helix-turn-helix domain-containing protein [Prevotella sp.]|nr:helix-turn-helix domain-containing protein [Prevotella sp.]